MPEKNLSEISRSWRELYEKGIAALHKQNYDYALAILNQVLQKEPAFYDCREALRATQFKKAGSGGGFFKKVLGTASLSPLLAKGQIALRSNPLEAIQIAETILNSDPSSTSAHKLLAEAALAADLPKTAVLSLEIALKNSPKDRDVAMKLGEALARAGQTARAETILSDLLRSNPNDPAIAQALKNISASRTMQEGGYDALSDGSGSYRDILKDKEQAVALEQEQRQVKSEDVADRLIQENKTRLAKEPNNLKVLRTIAELHAEKKEFDLALEHYDRILATEGAVDPSLERAITETKVRKIEHLISQLDPNAPDYSEKAARLEAEKQSIRLAEAQRRVEKYPNDLQIRF
ncbi:MAG: tetratricopeptide repeat protein, partial [Verrucomicrobiota bacterium]